ILDRSRIARAGPHRRRASALARRVLHRRVDEESIAHLDDSQDQQEQHRRDQRELDHALRKATWAFLSARSHRCHLHTSVRSSVVVRDDRALLGIAAPNPQPPTPNSRAESAPGCVRHRYAEPIAVETRAPSARYGLQMSVLSSGVLSSTGYYSFVK